MTKEVDAMVHDFILVYALDSGVGSQEDVLRELADSDCADARWAGDGRVMSAWLSAGKRATAMLQSRLQRCKWHRRCRGRYWSGLMPRSRCRHLMVTSSSNRAVPAQPHVRSAGRVSLP